MSPETYKYTAGTERVEDVDEYIEHAPEKYRGILQRVRETIREAAPDAKEKISYQMPTFWQRGNLIHFAAFKNHMGLYPGAEGINAFAERLHGDGYKFSKGAVQFPWNRPMPYDLIAEITRFCVKQVESK